MSRLPASSQRQASDSSDGKNQATSANLLLKASLVQALHILFLAIYLFRNYEDAYPLS